jgi:hypothetical protein
MFRLLKENREVEDQPGVRPGARRAAFASSVDFSEGGARSV